MLTVRACLRLLLPALLLAPLLPAADSVFADNAFTGRWDTPFEPVVFSQLNENEGAALMNAMKPGATAACPAASEKREFYTGRGARSDFTVYVCTNGAIITGFYTKISEGVTNPVAFVSDPIPDKASSFTITVSADGQSLRVPFTYADSTPFPTLGYAQPDSVSFFSSTPRNGAALRLGDPYPAFSGSVRFKLYRTKAASLVITLLDAQGTLSQSQPVPVALADDLRSQSYAFQPPAPSIRATSFLHIRAELLSPAGAVLASSTAAYAVYPQRGVSVSPLAFNFRDPNGVPHHGTITILDPAGQIDKLSVSVRTGPPFDSPYNGTTIDRISPLQGITRTVDFTVSAGDYWSEIILGWTGGNFVVPVWNYTGYPEQPVIRPDPPTLSFVVQKDSPPPAPASVSLSLAGAPLAASAWSIFLVEPNLLQAIPSSPSSFNVTPKPAATSTLGFRSTLLEVDSIPFVSVHRQGVMPVSIRVIPAGELLPATASPAALVFRQTLGPSGQVVNAPAQQFRVRCVSPTPVGVSAKAIVYSGADWLSVQNGAPGTYFTQCSSSQEGVVSIAVDPLKATLGAGMDTGQINLALGDKITAVRVQFYHLLNGAKVSTSARAADDLCVPKTLQITESQLPGSFSIYARGLQPLSVSLADDCGNPVTSASVSASFSNGDDSLQLANDGHGNFATLWQPILPFEKTTVTLFASAEGFPLASLDIDGEIIPVDDPIPSININGITDWRDPHPGAPLAPGAIIEIRGRNLAPREALAAEPWPTSFEGVEVTIGGVPAPIFFVSPTRILTQVPADLPPAPAYLLLLSSGGNFAKPETLNLPPSIQASPLQPSAQYRTAPD